METNDNTLTPAEQIAVEYADIMEQMVTLIKRLTAELAQYRAMDAEEELLESLIERTGGITGCGKV